MVTAWVWGVQEWVASSWRQGVPGTVDNLYTEEKLAMAKPNYTHIAIVLDRSGSMNSVKSDTIGGFNHFLNDQKQAPGEATLTLAQFDHVYEVVHDHVEIHCVPPLDDRTYQPRAGTALLDAIGRTIDSLGARLAAMPEQDRPGKVICVILTDGMENASRQYSSEKVFEMIGHQQEKYGWEFVFLGANQDAIATAARMGIHAGSSLTYAASSEGTTSAWMSLSAGARRRRASSDIAADYFNLADRKKQDDLQKGKDKPASS